MKRIIYSAVLLLAAAFPAAASEGVMSAISDLNAASPGVRFRPSQPTAAEGKRGGIPEVPPPTCVGDDCGDEEPYYPPVPPQPQQPPAPAPQPTPQPAPQPSPQPAPQPWTPYQPPYSPPAPPSADFQHRPFVASVCLAMADGSSDCRKGSGQEAINKLEASIRQDIVEELLKNGVVMVFPAATNPAEVYGALKTALQHSIDQLAIGMQADLDQVMRDMGEPGWGTPVDKARMARIVANNERMLKLWKAAALIEADNGGNWANIGGSSYKFVGGPAYNSLRDGLLAKEIFTGQRRAGKPARRDRD